MGNSDQDFSNIIPADRPDCEYYVSYKLAGIQKPYELQKGKQRVGLC